jgi:hypothetical protein
MKTKKSELFEEDTSVQEPSSPVFKSDDSREVDTFKFRLKELANLFTMFPPSILCLVLLKQDSITIDRFLFAICLGAVVHMPFAVGFHFASFLFPKTPHLLWEKLDLTFVHVASVFNVYGTSRSDGFALANLVLNSVFVIQSWSIGDPHWKRLRPRNYGIAILMQILPAVFYGLHWEFFGMLTWGLLGGTIYALKFFGIWSHAVFHLTLAGWQFHLLQAAVKATAPIA